MLYWLTLKPDSMGRAAFSLRSLWSYLRQFWTKLKSPPANFLIFAILFLVWRTGIIDRRRVSLETSTGGTFRWMPAELLEWYPILLVEIPNVQIAAWALPVPIDFPVQGWKTTELVWGQGKLWPGLRMAWMAMIYSKIMGELVPCLIFEVRLLPRFSVYNDSTSRITLTT